MQPFQWSPRRERMQYLLTQLQSIAEPIQHDAQAGSHGARLLLLCGISALTTCHEAHSLSVGAAEGCLSGLVVPGLCQRCASLHQPQ